MSLNYKNYTVMLVDDEQPILNSLKRLIKRLGCNIITFTSPLDALEALKGTSVQLVISDMRMPEMGGEVFLEQVAKSYPDIERVVISGYADAQATIDAVNRGKISRFLLKPWEDEDVFKVVEKGLQLAFLREENLRLQEETEAKNKQEGHHHHHH
uniref:Response regulator receiver:Metal-dependent phosphohydrolase, HD subdomain n=1 Tax=Neptuniibacter caesariensis TaxID=207954 RepID=UPI000175429A|nr:Chain A, Response regulator receiver:Metal-dependent phosphohydrolase, HD subdomain [Neptuniibacter caesariensis]